MPSTLRTDQPCRRDAPPQHPGASGPPGDLRAGANRAALLTGYALLTIGSSLLATLVPIHMLNLGLSTLAIGWVQAAYYGGYLGGAMVVEPIIRRLGQYRTLVIFCAVAVMLSTAFGLASALWGFMLVRLGTGFVFLGIFAAVESTLHMSTVNARRGRVFGLYLTVNYLAAGAGQFLLAAGDIKGPVPIYLASALFAAAIIPVSLGADEAAPRLGEPQADSRPRWWDTLLTVRRTCPAAIPACILVGMLYGSFFSMTPVFLAKIGLPVPTLSRFMGFALIGALLPQWPLGKLSDRIDRRSLARAMVIGSATASMLLVAVRAPSLVATTLFVYAAFTFTQYGLVISYVNDRMPGHARVHTSTVLLVLFSGGGATGPLAASLCMKAWGVSGLFLLNAGISMLVAFLLSRSLRRG